MTLRRLGEFDTWHFCRNCTRWPADGSGFEELAEDGWTPERGAKCGQCRAKREAGQCLPSQLRHPPADLGNTGRAIH